jgi:hypothetical protein
MCRNGRGNRDRDLALLDSPLPREEASLGHRNATMIVGLILALGMGGLLLVWLNLNEGSGIVGLLFIFGVVAGLVAVLAGALSGSDQD